jgi:hypothetical protein
MKSVRKFGAVLISSLLLASTMQADVAQAGLKISPNVVSLGLSFTENSQLAEMPSILFAQGDVNVQETWLMCPDLADKLCTDAAGIFGYSKWDICTDASTLACIADVWAVDSSGKKIAGEVVKKVPSDGRYAVKENPSINLPNSNGVGAVWRIPGVLNGAGKDTYFVAVQSVVNLRKAAGTPVANLKLNLGELTAGIMAVEEIPGTFQPATATDAKNGGRAWGSNGTQYAPDGSACAGTELTSCQAIREFPAGYRFGMTLRMGKKPEGWYHGRLYLPTITTKDWKTGAEISIEAEPVKVPSLDFIVPNADIPQKIRDLVFTDQYFGVKGDGVSATKISENVSGPNSLELVSGFAPSYKDKATTTASYWSFKNLNYGQDESTRKCSDDTGNLAGLVTTNALAYAAGPPVFDKETSSLSYKVSSPHFEANGAEASGSYDLTLRSDVARCIYGFSNAPIKAEISITSSDGEKKVATTTVNEKNGWLYLSAKGFTFSTPLINVKLSQDVVVVEKPAPAPEAVAPAKAVAKKSITITCVKGKASKKVTGAKPKCPTGYKKK